jgi:hypothetical protein
MSEQAMRDDDPFDWNDLEPEDIVGQAPAEVAAYLNPQGDLVIRGRAGDWERDDAVIVISRAYVPALIERVASLYGMEATAISHEPAALPPPAPPVRRDRTAAERQRRFRERRNQAGHGETIRTELNNAKEGAAG